MRKYFRFFLSGLLKVFQMNSSANHNSYMKKGSALYELGQYELAIKAYDKAIEFCSFENASYLFFLKSRMLYDLNQYDLALESINRVLDLDPTDAYAQGMKQFLLEETKK